MPGLAELASTLSGFDWQALRQRVEEVTGNLQQDIPEDVAGKLLLERAARFSRAVEEDAQDHAEVILFQHGDTRYAVPLHMLSEIRPIQRITPLPKVSAGIMGVINVRGRIVSVYSLGNRAADFQRETGGLALIGQGSTAHLALHADSIIGAERIPANAIKPPPVSIAGKDYITGIGSEGLVFLDLQKFCHFLQRQQQQR